ncbi:MAG: Rieske (2Fe-2S) protein, partial [Pseudomonadota bacterium]
MVARADEIAPGERKLVSIRGRDVVVFNVKGEYFALLDRCPHQGGSLCRGKLVGLVESDGPGRYRYARSGEIIRCPWHGWEYDLRTGKSRFDPKRSWVKHFEGKVEHGDQVVEGTYSGLFFTGIVSGCRRCIQQTAEILAFIPNNSKNAIYRSCFSFFNTNM